MEDYLNHRGQLIQTILVVDARHKPSNDDITMAKFIRSTHGNMFVIANKADKLSKKQLDEGLSLIYDTLNMCDNDFLIPFSAESGIGRDEVWDIIISIITADEEL